MFATDARKNTQQELTFRVSVAKKFKLRHHRILKIAINSSLIVNLALVPL